MRGKREMKHKFFTARLLFVFLVVFLGACATSDHYQTIAVGDSRDKVFELLGSPSNPEKDLTGNERESIKSALKKTNNLDSESFSIWKRDRDLFYIVGFNKK